MTRDVYKSVGGKYYVTYEGEEVEAVFAGGGFSRSIVETIPGAGLVYWRLPALVSVRNS